MVPSAQSQTESVPFAQRRANNVPTALSQTESVLFAQSRAKNVPTAKVGQRVCLRWANRDHQRATTSGLLAKASPHSLEVHPQQLT